MVTKRKAPKKTKTKDTDAPAQAPAAQPVVRSDGSPEVVPASTYTDAIPSGGVSTQVATPNDSSLNSAPINSGSVEQNSVAQQAQQPSNPAAYSRAAASKRIADQRKKHRFRRWRKRIIIAIIVVIVVVIVGGFSWDRWFRYNDETDLEGTWVVHNTHTAVVIDGETISFADDIAYSYEIDPESKTITYTFGTMEGGGRYRFSADRNQVAIVDGDSYSWWSTLWDDVGWSFNQAIEYIQGKQTGVSDMAEDENTTVLDRTS